ncbi:glycosyltransferase family 2 protein [Flavobacterium tyrosinilyticum]|uniref:glycosyltransferase family 2 protein n=1 Tax=Flavobacterium tyrosinilyticum TaxID=1658740 RepID=UPI00202F50C8|nr:glycosyltransferase family 2 protein [Flavobacterium tyrosinilyticum]MCM0668642.1 glycosyltransferase family 2 protein [Flavobacterium tyrosinilyticum]
MIAIVIPYYKLSFFEEALQSLANQTDKRFKVYIGDDDSPENPLDLLKKFKDKFNFLYHRFETNLGGNSLTQQWHRCITLTEKEEWIMILGDDDVLEENTIEEFYKKLPEIKSEGINVIRYATQIFNEKSNTNSEIYYHPTKEKSTDFLFRRSRSSLSEYIFLKEKVLKIGFVDFPLAWYSDVLGVLEFSAFGIVFTINESVIKIRVSSISISGNILYSKKKNNSKFDFYYYLLSHKKHFFSKTQQEELFLNISTCYINDKKRIPFFFKISWLYIKNLSIVGFSRFIRLILFYTFKKK